MVTYCHRSMWTSRKNIANCVLSSRAWSRCSVAMGRLTFLYQIMDHNMHQKSLLVLLLIGNSSMWHHHLVVLEAKVGLRNAVKTVKHLFTKCREDDFLITRVTRDIYIFVKFLVTTESNPYMLYKLALFPIVTPNNDEHATLLDTKTIAFAYSRLSAVVYWISSETYCVWTYAWYFTLWWNVSFNC